MKLLRPQVLLESSYEQRIVRVGAESRRKEALLNFMYEHGYPVLLNDTRWERLKTEVASFGLRMAMAQNRYSGPPIKNEALPDPDGNQLVVPDYFLPDIVDSLLAVTEFGVFRSYAHSVDSHQALTLVHDCWLLIGHDDN